MLAILRSSVEPEAEPIFAAQRLGNTAPMKSRSGGDTVSDLTGMGIEP